MIYFFVFKQKTAYELRISDWSSDVCSSDLFTYTYVDGGAFVNPDLAGNRGLFSSGQPLAGISKNTINATVFYEKGPLAMRAAYNWRSDFLITPQIGRESCRERVCQ